MKQNKFIILSALLALSAATPAEAQIDAADSAQVNVAFRKVAKEDIMGGVSSVNYRELMDKNYNTYSLDNLQGYVAGYNGNGMWGFTDQLVLIDGVPREANNVMPSEIEEITFLKGAQAVVLYGSRAAKGAVLITTKRGRVTDGLSVQVRANTGWNVAKAYPEYISSAEYMTLYNEARANDGLAALYTPDQIYNYASGENPYRYSDVDFYSSDFIKKAYNRTDATVEIEGGNDRAKFYSNVSYYRNGDFLNFGEAKNNYTDRFNVRGNVDVRINNFITAYVNANATYYNSRSAISNHKKLDANGAVVRENNQDVICNYWEAAANWRPNRYNPLIPISYLDPNAIQPHNALSSTTNIIDGKYFLAAGATDVDRNNIFADYYAAGKSTWTSRQFQFDAGVNVDLNSVLKGLSFHALVGVDYQTSYSTSYNNKYATFEPAWSNYNGPDLILSLDNHETVDKKSGQQDISGSTNHQMITFNAHFDYNRTFADKHNVSAMVVANGFQQTRSGQYHKVSNANLGLNLSYNYAHKYYVDFAVAAPWSAKLPEKKLLRGHDDVVTCISLSHNGELLASGQKGKNSDIFVWNYKTGNVIYTLSEHDYEVSCLAFSTDDRLLFSCGNIQDKRSFIWDMKTGNIVLNLTPMFPLPTVFATWGGFVRDIRGNKTKYYQYATCGDNQICLWNVDPYKGTQERGEVQTGNFVRNYICMAFSLNDEKYLYAGTTSGDIVCILVKNRAIVFNKIICAQGVTAIVPLTKNEIIVGGGDGSLVLLYIDEPKCEELARVKLYGAIYSLSSSFDGIQLLASTDKGFIYRIRAADLSNILLNENHTDAIINFFSYNDDLYRFSTCSNDGTIRLWNLDDYSVSSRIFINPEIIPLCMKFNDDILISGWSDGKLRCYRNVRGEELLWSIENIHNGGVTAVTHNRDARIIISGGANGEIRLWEVRSKEMISNLKEHLQRVTHLELFKDDVHLMSTSKDKSILIWDLNKEKRIASYTLSSGGVNNFRINPIDENIVISVGQDRKITHWDLRYPQPIKIISSNPYGKIDLADELFGLAISNDGHYVSTGGALGIIRTYDLTNSLGFVGEYYAHSKTCSGLAYTYDNKYLISTGHDSLILSFTTGYMGNPDPNQEPKVVKEPQDLYNDNNPNSPQGNK